MIGDVQLFNTLSATGASIALALGGGSDGARRGLDEATVQVEITATATVDIEARLVGTLSWAKVETGVTANKLVRVGRAREVRLNATITSGTVTGALME